MTQKWEVQTRFTYGWENVWTEQDSENDPPKLWVFDSYDAAAKELADFFADMKDSEMDYEPDDYRIVAVGGDASAMREQVRLELQQMKLVGLHVPDRALMLAETYDLSGCDNMSIGEIAEMLIELAEINDG